MRYIQNNQGYALLFVLFIIAVLGIYTPTLILTTFQGHKTINNTANDTQALSLAEGSLEIGYRSLVDQYNSTQHFYNYSTSQFNTVLSNAVSAVQKQSNSEYPTGSPNSMSLDFNPNPLNLISNSYYQITLTGIGTYGGSTKKVTTSLTIAPMLSSLGVPLAMGTGAQPTYNSLNNQLFTVSLPSGVTPYVGDIGSSTKPLPDLTSYLPSGSIAAIYSPDASNAPANATANTASPNYYSITLSGGAADQNNMITADTIQIYVPQQQSNSITVNKFLVCRTLYINQPVSSSNNAKGPVYLKGGVLVYNQFAASLQTGSNPSLQISANSNNFNGVTYNLNGYLSALSMQY